MRGLIALLAVARLRRPERPVAAVAVLHRHGPEGGRQGASGRQRDGEPVPHQLCREPYGPGQVLGERFAYGGGRRVPLEPCRHTGSEEVDLLLGQDEFGVLILEPDEEERGGPEKLRPGMDRLGQGWTRGLLGGGRGGGVRGRARAVQGAGAPVREWAPVSGPGGACGAWRPAAGPASASAPCRGRPGPGGCTRPCACRPCPPANVLACA